MKKPVLILALLLFVGLTSFYLVPSEKTTAGSLYISYTVDLKKQDLAFYWKDENNKRFGNLGALKDWCEENNKKLVFAMNGGMYNKDHLPQGLYIESYQELARLDTITQGYGNFYMQPNGVFCVTKDGTGVVCKSIEFGNFETIIYATQSGPMLLIDGNIHPVFMGGSKSLRIRNGVGVLPDGKLLFVISKEKVNFHDFATFFKKRGCKNALYLDGNISRVFIAEQGIEQMDGDFGVIIAVTKDE